MTDDETIENRCNSKVLFEEIPNKTKIVTTNSKKIKFISIM